ARLRGRLHATRDEADRGRTRADRITLRGRLRAGRESPAAEGAHRQAQTASAQAARRPAAGRGSGRSGWSREEGWAEAPPPPAQACRGQRLRAHAETGTRRRGVTLR